MSYVKEYVQVHLTVDEEGLVVPTSIVFHKEKKYDIESVTASIRAAATKVLGRAADVRAGVFAGRDSKPKGSKLRSKFRGA